MNTTPNTTHTPERQAPQALINRVDLLRRADVIIDLAANSMPADETYHAMPTIPHRAVPVAAEQLLHQTTFVEQPRPMIGQVAPAHTEAGPTYPLPIEEQARLAELREQVENARF